MYIYIHTYIYTYIYTHTHTYIYVCVCVCPYIYIYKENNSQKVISEFEASLRHRLLKEEVANIHIYSIYIYIDR